jgi:prevent-host-death family protein
MSDMTIRDLRNHGGEVIDRVLSGETVVVTRSGVPVAELVPLRPQGLDAASLLARWRSVPPIDIAAFRSDIDRVLDAPHPDAADTA